MTDELDLLTDFHKTLSDAQELALNTIHNIEMPICNGFTNLTSKDCIHLMVRIFFFYLKINIIAYCFIYCVVCVFSNIIMNFYIAYSNPNIFKTVVCTLICTLIYKQIKYSIFRLCLLYFIILILTYPKNIYLNDL